ncbi:hypothetical protein ACEWY4_007971 [Coilia grayii]|uniref:FIIND domain-containing protein n=1 Tax=Coilia grayii TaxID=363190 RepID=A0ABD1KAB5_9TELE
MSKTKGSRPLCPRPRPRDQDHYVQDQEIKTSMSKTKTKIKTIMSDTKTETKIKTIMFETKIKRSRPLLQLPAQQRGSLGASGEEPRPARYSRETLLQLQTKLIPEMTSQHAGLDKIPKEPTRVEMNISNSCYDPTKRLLRLSCKVLQDSDVKTLSAHCQQQSQEEEHHRISGRSCEFCAEVPDTSHWVLVEPEVSTENSVSTYSLSSSAGSYECSLSGLRWSCAGPVSLQYCFTDWYVFAEELAHMQSSPADGHQAQASVYDAVRVLHGRDSGVCVEECELTRHHARIVHPSLSLLGLVWRALHLFSPKVHCELLLFCTRTAPLNLHVYLVPTDPAHIQAIHQKETLQGVRIHIPGTVGPLQWEASVCVRTSCQSEIQPKKMNLRPLSISNYCEVYMEHPEDGFDMEVSSPQHAEPIWQARIRRDDYQQSFIHRQSHWPGDLRQHPSCSHQSGENESPL